MGITAEDIKRFLIGRPKTWREYRVGVVLGVVVGAALIAVVALFIGPGFIPVAALCVVLALGVQAVPLALEMRRRR